jgi:hypothetical protein
MSLTKVSYSMVNGAQINVLDYGAYRDGSNATATTAAIQAAFAAASSGGVVYFPTGTYKLDSTGIQLLNTSNVTVQGDGMGASIIDGSAVNGVSIFKLGNISGPATLNNVTLKDFSIYGSSTAATTHIIDFRGINNFVADGVEVYNGYAEAFFCDGPDPAFTGLTVRNCYFHDCNKGVLSYGIDTNTTGITSILITGNTFKNMNTAVFVLGTDVVISNNTFINTAEYGIKVGESNFTNNCSLSSCVVANNTFDGTGVKIPGGYPFGLGVGIRTAVKNYQYLDGTRDNGIVIANNTFKDSYSYADKGLSLIYLTGNVKAIGNYASNLVSGAGVSIFINIAFSDITVAGANTDPIFTFIENNTLEQSNGGVPIQFGLAVQKIQNAFLYCSGNSLFASTSGAYYYSANTYLPYVSFNGDIVGQANSVYDLVGSDPGLGAIPVPIYGTNSTTFYTVNSEDLFGSIPSRTLTTATPSVATGVYFHTLNAAPLSITDFINAPSVSGCEITIYFGDANTTVVHNATKIVLNGSVNFVSTVGASLTLYKPNLINSAWYEKSRSKP